MRAAWLLALVACTGTEPDAALLDPETCATCHPDHVEQWRGSMHAHASDDPVFRAMNQVAQQTEGVPPDFCVQCHAPVALRTGATVDGLDMDQVPEHLRGVTCAFCHQTEGAHGTSNAAVDWTFDGVMRGAFSDPVPNEVHEASYSPHLDREDRRSSDVCGACHDVVLPDGLHLEKTYAEWEQTVFVEGPSRQGCTHCHMPGSAGRVATAEGAPERRVHDHSMPGVDVALIDWPGKEAQRQGIQYLLDRTLLAELCVAPDAGGAQILLTLENILAGHDFPSGASHDRRVWVEVVATADGREVLRSGTVPDGVALSDVRDARRVELHDIATTAEGDVSHAIVDAVALEERALVAPPDSGLPHARSFSWPVTGTVPDRVEVRVRLRPIGLDVLGSLVDDGLLDPSIPDAMPTFDLGGTALVWEGEPGSCVGG